MLASLQNVDSIWAVGLAAAQAVFYALTGLWPLVHMRSFLAVTGGQHVLWLVKTLGALITAVAVPMALAAARGTMPPKVVVLAIGCAIALGAADVNYVVRRIIPPIYLLDAVVEGVLVLGWVLRVLMA